MCLSKVSASARSVRQADHRQPAPAAPVTAVTTGHTSQDIPGTHICYLASTAPPSSVLAAESVSLAPTSLSFSDEAVSSTPASQHTTEASVPTNSTGMPSLPSPAPLHVNLCEHNSALTYPRNMDVASLLKQLNDDHHDCELGFLQLPATGLAEAGQVATTWTT